MTQKKRPQSNMRRATVIAPTRRERAAVSPPEINYLLGTRECKAEIGDGLDHAHEGENIGVNGIALSPEDASKIGNKQQRKEILEYLKAILPKRVLVECIVLHRQHPPIKTKETLASLLR